MKFPYELSEQRLSLLSKDDRAIYDYEHSIFYSKQLREEGLKMYQQSLLEGRQYYMNILNEDAEYNDLSEIEKTQIADTISKAEAIEYVDMLSEELFSDLVGDGMLTEEDASYAKNQMIEALMEVDTDTMINEADYVSPGKDMHWWWEGSFTGAAFKAALGGCATVLGGLLIAGKDKLAQKALERYMNKLVEMIDNGQNKKKSIFAFFGSKNSANESQGCFRSILENVERNRYTQGVTFAKAAGLFGNDPISEAEHNDTTNGSFYKLFQEKIGNKINKLGNN